MAVAPHTLGLIFSPSRKRISNKPPDLLSRTTTCRCEVLNNSDGENKWIVQCPSRYVSNEDGCHPYPTVVRGAAEAGQPSIGVQGISFITAIGLSECQAVTYPSTGLCPLCQPKPWLCAPHRRDALLSISTAALITLPFASATASTSVPNEPFCGVTDNVPSFAYTVPWDQYTVDFAGKKTWCRRVGKQPATGIQALFPGNTSRLDS
jgi:hypothetical protein